jgi:hypothetical protein
LIDLSRLLREPLLHFFLIGGVVFGTFSLLSPPAPPPVDVISIGPDRVDQLAQSFEAVWKRPPTETELAALTDDFVRSEIYYREALALGLDQNDTVIRQRLRQKMEFFTSASVGQKPATDPELDAWLTANPDIYRQEPRIALQQVFLGTDQTAGQNEKLLAELTENPDADFTALGLRTLLPSELGLSRPRGVDGVFGQGFFDQLGSLPEGVWSGPFASGYGLHLVRITDSQPGRLPLLEEVRDAVTRDWEAAQEEAARTAAFERLRERYVVEIDGATSPEIARP